MALFNYNNTVNTALNLIGKFGQKTKMVDISGSYDPISGLSSDQDIKVSDATVVTLPSGSFNFGNYDDKYKEDLKKGKLRFFYLAAKGISFHPQPGHMLLFEENVWDIVGSTPLNPAGIPIMFSLGCYTSGKYDYVNLIEQLEILGLVFPKDWTL